MSSSMAESKMVESSLPPLPQKRVIVGCGIVSVDYVAVVDGFPQPDDKMRTRSLQVCGGGNAGNTLTCAARLGLAPRILTKVGDDINGKNSLAVLEADGVDTSYVKIAEGGTSFFTYVIVDNQTKTRTCLYTPGFPTMIPDDLPRSSLVAALDEARLLYVEGKAHKTALAVAQEAARRNIPILIDAEKRKSGLDAVLSLASYIVCSEKFPQAWTTVPSIPSALVSILATWPSIKFVVATLGENGCIMIERSMAVGEERMINPVDVEALTESLKLKIDKSNVLPTCVSSESDMKLCANGIGTVTGRLLLGTAECIPSSELIDTTGAGDAFIGGIMYGSCKVQGIGCPYRIAKNNGFLLSSILTLEQCPSHHETLMLPRGYLGEIKIYLRFGMNTASGAKLMFNVLDKLMPLKVLMCK